jgi:hypothetical protein
MAALAISANGDEPKVMRIRSALLLLMLIGTMAAPGAMAQIVVEDATEFTDKDCRWLHRQFLGECSNSQRCPHTRDDINLSMSTVRGLSALETVLTVRAADQMDIACLQACKTKERMPYNEWRKRICEPLIKHRRIERDR